MTISRDLADLVPTLKESGGNLGVGTASPSYAIDVAGTSPRVNVAASSTSFAGFRAANTSGNFQIAIDDSTGSSFLGTAYGRVIYSSGAYPIQFATNATERMRIDSSGTILAGLTSSTGSSPMRVQVKGASGGANPLAGYSIVSANDEVAGHIVLAASSENSITIAADPQNLRATTSLQFSVDGTERMRITSAGVVGINTTSPPTTFSVNGTISVGSSTSNYWPIASSTSPVFYISPTGNDSTGDGSNGNPWATLTKAMYALSKVVPHGNVNGQVIFKNGTYTLSSVQYARGFSGGGTIYITAETAGSVTVNCNGNQFVFERNQCVFEIGGITFNSTTQPGMFNITDTLRVQFNSNCAINNLTSGDAPGNFNQCIGVYDSGLSLQCPLTLTYQSSYGAVINIQGNSNAYFSGTISKSGTRHGNAAVSVQGTSYVTFQNTINNFAIGINMGQSHYDAEYAGFAIANNLSLTNCTIGIRLSNFGLFKNYYIASTSGTTTPVYWLNGWYSGQLGTEYHYIGYNTSVSSSYRLQVNSQIYATSSTIATSDGRFKKNVVEINNALDLVKKLRPVQFDWIPHEVHNFDVENTTIGFIAQEVQEALAGEAYLDSIVKKNELVLEAEQYENKIITPAQGEVFDENGKLISVAVPAVTEKVVIKPAVKEEFLGIAEGNLIALLTKAIQELKVELDAVKSELQTLKGN